MDNYNNGSTPAMGYVALALSILSVIIGWIACCCAPILFGSISLIMAIVALVLNIVAGNQMKAMTGDSNTFIKITRIVEIVIIVFAVIGFGLDIVATIINVKNAFDPNSQMNQILNQLTGGH